MHFLASAVVTVVTTTAYAQQAYPDHPIRMLVGQSPGSATDIVARLMAAKMSATLGQSIVVENRAGAGGVLAASFMAQAKPDGYSILMTTASQTSLAPQLMSSLPYDPFRDFTYISPVTDVAMLLVASSKSGIGDLAALVKQAKSNPGKINFGSSGMGSASHLALEMLAQLTSIQLAHIPYKGTAPAITSVVAGETSLHVNALGNLIPLVQSGKVVPIAVLTDQRSARLPDVPSLTDLGLKMPRVASWIGLIGPAALPQPVTQKLADAVQAAKNDPEIKQKFLDLGLIPFDGSGQDFRKRAEDDSRVWGQLIHDRGIRAD